MKINCGTCKYKGKPIKKVSHADYGQGEACEKFGDHFLCELIKSPDEEVEKIPNAFVVDASGYFAALCVDDDFGCVKWEEKNG